MLKSKKKNKKDMSPAPERSRDEIRVCVHCGCPLPSDASFCPHCGHVRAEVHESAELPRGKKAKKSLRERMERIAGGSMAECTNDLVAFEMMTVTGLARDERGRWSRTLTFGDTAFDQERR